MTDKGQSASATAEIAVALSLLRLGPDTRAARVFKELTSTHGAGRSAHAQTDGSGISAHPHIAVLIWRLAQAIGIPPEERSAHVAIARQHAARAIALARHCGIQVLSCFDQGYPELLREIPDPPIALWTKGDPACLARPTIAVVGSRQATPAGIAIARRLGRELSEAGLVVTSGLARGVDAAAHQGAIDAGGPTIAVLGSGLDVVYPREHTDLAKRLTEAGLLMSEFPPGTPPLQHHFPLRNRIISGLARAVVVIEASEKSGSLITAKAALEQGRDVLAVPGNVASGRYRGSHALIKDGAPLVETVDDILRELGWARESATQTDLDVKPLEISSLEAIMAVGEIYTVDDLADRTGLSPSALLAEMGTLEVQGRASRTAGGGFVRLDKSAIGEGDA